MVDGLRPADIILASTPDDAVPIEKVETNATTRQKARRARRFLKGPVPLSRIHDHIRGPAEQLLLVLVAHTDMQQSTELKITSGILRDAGISNRKAAYRALGALEINGSLTLQRHRGRRPVVHLTARPVGWMLYDRFT